jgi:DNA-binding CsgD family transcriptional regulator
MELLERDAVLAQLSEALGRAATGRGLVVAISGEAGIGKTSVVRRFVAERDGDARVLWGACDDLAVPRPLGPFRDIAEGCPGSLADGLASGDRVEVFRAMLDELGRESPTICVVEDAHWADEATLDVLAFVGRRIEEVGALLVVTFRDDELPPDHPLRRALAAVPPEAHLRLPLDPLSEAAVRSLAGAGGDAAAIHAATGGNPFFVSEALDAGLAPTPASVRDAVLARAARLSPEARSALELVSVVPARAELWLIEECLGDSTRLLGECERRGLLIVDAGVAGFRHELARRAVEEALPGARRIGLNRQVLAALSRHGAEPARLAHHAEEAGDAAAIVEHCLAAARQAVAVRSHREAQAFFAQALRDAGRLEVPERARAFEELSLEAYYAGDATAAIEAREHALALRRDLGSPLEVGDGLRWMSRLRWWVGDREGAERAGAEALEVLGDLPPGRELAMALSNSAQLAMLAQRSDDALREGRAAMALAADLDDTEILVHAQTNVGTELMRSDAEAGRRLLADSAAMAAEAGLDDHACRAFTNMSWNDLDFCRLDLAERTAREGLAFAHEREQRGFALYLIASQALIDLARGRWQAAAEGATSLVEEPEFTEIGRVPALHVLGIVRVRRGEPGGSDLLAEAWDLARGSRELQRIRPVACARAEIAWLASDPEGVDEATRDAFALALRVGHEWDVGKLAIWRHRAGVLSGTPGACARPFALEIEGDPRAAAEAWRELGVPYLQALALVGAGDGPALLEALDLLDGLGASAASRLVRAELRRLGVRNVPRGPRPATRANPAGLSARQLEIAGLLALGLSNREISERLVISPRTVEHHVAAVLVKLGVGSRAQVADLGAELGVESEDGWTGAPT